MLELYIKDISKILDSSYSKTKSVGKKYFNKEATELVIKNKRNL